MRHTAAKAHSNGIEVAYEVFGDATDPVVLLIAGMACPGVFWPDTFVASLVDHGYRVVRYDHRDLGASDRTATKPTPIALTLAALASRQGHRVAARAAYDLDTLVVDAVGLLDALGIGGAHWIGFSMGGMIAQIAAADHPARVTSLTSIASSCNDGDLPLPQARVLRAMAKPPARTHAGRVRQLAATFEALTGPEWTSSPNERRHYAERVLSGGGNPSAPSHHLAAVVATGSLRRRLANIDAPTLVVHGDADPMIAVEGGRRTVDAIPNAKLFTLAGLGHDLPACAHGQILDVLLPFLSQAAQSSTARPEAGVRITEAAVDHAAIVVGAGLSGLAAAIRLADHGVEDVLILEAADAIGGTWRDNTYPGCACDVQSHLYSLSFAPKADWSRVYAPWHEIRDYTHDVAERFGLRQKIALNHRLTAARFDDTQGIWELEVASDGRVRKLTTRALVLAIGPLSVPRLPAIAGLETFTGEAFHSARWNHDLDLSDKRVAVIGTGASAIQFVPHVARDAADLVVFQRTPPWILPRQDRAFSKLEKRVMRHVDVVRRAYRGWLYGFKEWGLQAFLTPESRLRVIAERKARTHLAEQVADPDLRAALTPAYALGCKRVLVSDDYYPALTRDNVTLETARIASVDGDTLVMADGRRHPFDVLIYGTGFQVDRPSAGLSITGRDGADLETQWADDGFSAYLGTSVRNFPNLFVMAGPNTGIGHTSLLVMVEAQADHMAQAVAHLQRGTARALEVRSEVQQRYVDEVRSKFPGTVWSSGCQSWYLAQSSGANFSIWPDFTYRFRARVRRLRLADYRITTASRRPPRHRRGDRPTKRMQAHADSPRGDAKC